LRREYNYKSEGLHGGKARGMRENMGMVLGWRGEKAVVTGEKGETLPAQKKPNPEKKGNLFATSEKGIREGYGGGQG